MGKTDGDRGRRLNLLHPQGRLGRRSDLEKEKSGAASVQEQTILSDDCTSVSWGQTGLRLKLSAYSGGFDYPFPISNLLTMSNLFTG